MKFKLSLFKLSYLTTMYFLAAFYLPEFASAEDVLKPIKASGETTITATAGAVRATVSITTHILNIGMPQNGPPQKRTSSCTYSRYPCSLVDRMDFSVNGKNLFAARSVFADLADIDDAGLTSNGGVFILSLKCGDASEAYNVTIQFNGTQVQDRKISDPGTGHVFQETRYSPLQ